MSTHFAFADRNCAAIALAGLLLALTGCSPNAEIAMYQPFVPQAEIVLLQPFAPPSQQQLKLASKWAFEAAENDRRAWLLAFPLPSEPDGPRDFNLYLSTPDGVANFTVDQTSPTGVRGFLIQEVGDLRGKTVITSGEVRVSKAWFDRRRYSLDLNVACNDGTVIIGRTVAAAPLPTEISTFERHYSGDVLALTPQKNVHGLAADKAAGQAKATP